MTTADHDSATNAPACPDSNGHQAILVGAERLLADTADAITPGTPARDLLACLTRYRTHLSALAAAIRAAANQP